MDHFPEDILRRFLRYVEIDTSSSRDALESPSTPGQWELLRLLEGELLAMGGLSVELRPEGYLIARIGPSPGCQAVESLGFMAHVDTSDEVSGTVNPRLWPKYGGQTLELGPGIALSPEEFPELGGREGDTIISSDGQSLLGADDKAGLAIIMSLLAWLIAHPEFSHGPIEAVFSPDEETGKGLPGFEPAWLRSKAVYTVDGGRLGEVEYECFNAYEARLRFIGRSIHLGKARDKLVNALSMMADFVAGLPSRESPETSDAWQGYYCPLEGRGDIESASCLVFLRDFSQSGMERRLGAVSALAKSVEARFPGGRVELETKLQYSNMGPRLAESPEVIERLRLACRANGIEPISNPIRGGTDGARLTALGIPSPNLFTGGYNPHSRQEWASLSEMCRAALVLRSLAEIWARA